jgi:hypothetical protein
MSSHLHHNIGLQQHLESVGKFRRHFPLVAVEGIPVKREGDDLLVPCFRTRTHALRFDNTHIHPSIPHPSFSMSTSRASACAWDDSRIRKYEKEIDAAPSVLVLPRAYAYIYADNPIFVFPLHIQPPLLFHGSNTGFLLI